MTPGDISRGPEERSADALPERFGDYRVEREIGRGGMGVVYLARDPRLERRVAIKVLAPELAGDPDRLTRLRREARALAALNHPNIAAIYGMEEDPRRGRFLILEWVEGQTLAEVLDAGPLPPMQAIEFARQVAEALEAAHAQGVVHRDIKPRNIVITPGARAKVLDFGLARRIESAAWEESGAIAGRDAMSSMTDGSGAAMGTASYMSPERIVGEKEDHRSDVFSFGCVLYECVSGRRAFAAATRFGALAAVLSSRADLNALDASVPTALRDLIASCLQRSPEARPQRMKDVLAALADAVAELETLDDASAHGPNNLPAERTSFIGRRRELAECTRLLDGTRLLTLTGIGGCGKTRLALRLAARRLATFPGGVWFVDLAPLQEAERVALTVATALGVHETPGTELFGSLIARLAEAPTMLVLDNCEHVLGAAASLVDALLTACPALRILVTSREGLGVDGERAFSLPSLSLPSPSQGEDLGVIEASEAVQLFVDRARQVDGRFELNARTATAVAEICRRLDGIPLAIELAAARVKLLTVEEMRHLLHDRFRLLTGGSRTALPRHQTLRATIQWSEEQLADPERRLFHLLSVFAGGWTLEAGARVAWSDVDEIAALAGLGRLVDKSLVLTERAADGAVRYAMLETVRQFAQERLDLTAEGHGARTRHLDYYVALVERAAPQLVGAQLGVWLERLEPEQENLLSAHAWCEHTEDGGTKGLRLTAGLLRYWTSRGLLELGARVAREALDRPSAAARTAQRAAALYAAGILSYSRGRYDEVEVFWEENHAICVELGDRGGAARADMGLGTIAVAQGRSQVARARFEEAIRAAREAGAKPIVGAALNGLAELHRVEGDLVRATTLYEESLATFREEGSFNVAVLLLNLAMVGIQRGDLTTSRARLAEVSRLAEKAEVKFAGGGILEVSASLAAATGDFERAARIWGASETARARMGGSLAPGDAQFVSPWIDRARAALGPEAFADAERAGRGLPGETALAETRVWLEFGDTASSA
jgi:non-specific serine/threonine protein kinase